MPKVRSYLVTATALAFLCLLPFELRRSRSEAATERIHFKDGIPNAQRPHGRLALQAFAQIGEGQIGFSNDIALCDSFMVSVDAAAPLRIWLFHRITGRLIRSAITKGDAPGHLVSPVSIAFIGGRCDRIVVYEISNARAQVFTIPQLALARSPLRFDQPLFNITVLGDTLIANGFFRDNKLLREYVVSSRGPDFLRSAVVGQFTPLPEIESAILNRSYMAYEPHRQRFAIALVYAGRIIIADRAGNTLVRTSALSEITPIVKRGTNTVPVQLSYSSRWAYTDVAVTRCFVYALFSGKPRGHRDRFSFFGNTIHVFDWSGQLIDVLRSDSPLFGIGASETDGELYGIANYIPARILHFRIEGRPVAQVIGMRHFQDTSCR